MRRFAFVALILFAACTETFPVNRVPRQRLIALSVLGDTVAKLDGDNCWTQDNGRSGYIYDASGHATGRQSVATQNGTLICVNLP